MARITPFLTFDTQAEEAVQFYTSIFPNSSVLSQQRYGEGMPMPAGTLMVCDFVLDGQPLTALNAGPSFEFGMGISLMIQVDTQAEVDHYWSRLTEGGKEIQCGWLTDKFGITWRVVPNQLMRLINDPDPARAGRVLQAMMQMVKFDIAALEAAAAG